MIGPVSPRFPDHPREWAEVERGFHTVTSMDNVVGAIDGSYIALSDGALKGDLRKIKERFYNRKGYAAWTLQAVVDSRRRFMDIDIRCPSGVGDWNAFKHSNIGRRGQNPLPDGKYLLADAGYFSHDMLVTPYSRQTEYTERQRNFNYLHSAGRAAVEDAFGILKARFPRLSNDHKLAMPAHKVPALVLAACILHNICREESDQLMRQHSLEHGPRHRKFDTYEPRTDIAFGVFVEEVDADVAAMVAPDAEFAPAAGAPQVAIRRPVLVAEPPEARHLLREPWELQDEEGDILGIGDVAMRCNRRRDEIMARLPIRRSYRVPPLDIVYDRVVEI